MRVKPSLDWREIRRRRRERRSRRETKALLRAITTVKLGAIDRALSAAFAAHERAAQNINRLQERIDRNLGAAGVNVAFAPSSPPE